ncbi:MAG: GNAT family N-acetyltransferase [Rubricoccaceae bacterium]|nr:GNAT family N-acetyltransferase [Rubricoccaceae bacterium]
MPVFEKTRGPVRVAALPPLAPVVSPLLAEPLAEPLVHARRSPLDALLLFLAERYAQASLLLHPSLGDLRPLVWGGWTVTPRYTYLLDLAATDGLAGWSASARRRARGSGDDYRIEEDDRLAEAAVALMEQSYARHGEALGLDGDAVRRLARRFCIDGLARTMAARSSETGAVEAAVVLAHDGRTAHYWIAGSRPGPAMTVLLAALLPRLRADGFLSFDFVGANTPSIAEFKRRFGPRLVLAPRAVHRRPALRLLHALRGT